MDQKRVTSAPTLYLSTFFSNNQQINIICGKLQAQLRNLVVDTQFVFIFCGVFNGSATCRRLLLKVLTSHYFDYNHIEAANAHKKYLRVPMQCKYGPDAMEQLVRVNPVTFLEAYRFSNHKFVIVNMETNKRRSIFSSRAATLKFISLHEF